MRFCIKKAALFVAVFIAGIACAFSKEAVFEGEDYSIELSYNDSACPGDAVFVRMKFTQTSRKNKVSHTEFGSTEASMEFFAGENKLSQSQFYQLPKSSSRTVLTMLSGIPLSSWLDSEEKYSVKITYSLYGQKKYEFSLPVKIEPKTFVSETLDLDENNTMIKTDTSPERMRQIAELNDILATTDMQSVYQTTSFAAPTDSTRRTSFFADRRVYAYTNGKSSTSLHNGIDYGIPEGTNVLSCAAGKVVLAKSRISTGWSVVIEHLPGLYSLYYHMSSLNVKEGDTVKQGDLIGLSGSTGLATGPHLHWEVRLNMAAVSPDFFLNNFAFESLQ
ncbi:M23 family metallopeptidase [uncultured Treponema sp.]|uniref:M23 family metallopeptidase n=1 Tax=uncultured Treponema sp. TaxID=162155 RepID=UPI002592CACC|nr:M23 family metallopeptidase [uncultured Treponema sp.]